MADTDAGGGAGVTLAGGTVLGAFGYASTGADGWHVAQRLDLGGLTEDAVAEGTRLIERLAWWPGEPLTVGTDPYQRPRRLAWLGSGTTPRRFLVHTIHAENDASNRPDNNYSECLVVAAGQAATSLQTARLGETESAGGAQASGLPRELRSPRPSQLWAVEGWATPWGAEAVSHARPGPHPLETPRPGPEVIQLILSDPSSLLRLRCLLAAVHRALHLGGHKVAGVVDDLVWGAVLLDTAVALLPSAAAWQVTFDLRSLPPAHRFSLSGAPGALVRLLGHSHQTSAVPMQALDLTSECDEVRLEATLTHADDNGCPRCGQWHASIDRLLRQGAAVTPALLDRQLTELAEGMQRLRSLPATGNAMDSPQVGVGSVHRVGPSDTRSGESRSALPARRPPNVRPPTEPARGAPDDRPTESNWRPTDDRPDRQPADDSPAQRLYTPRNRQGGGRPLPAVDPRTGGSPYARAVPAVSPPIGGVELQALDQCVELLTDCRARLLGHTRGPAPSGHLRATWANVRELAELALARLGEDPADRRPSVRGDSQTSPLTAADGGDSSRIGTNERLGPEPDTSPGTGHDPYGRSDPW